MIKFAIALALFAVTLAAPFVPELDEHWKIYKTVHNKTYNVNEESARRLIWEENLAKIIRHNIESDLGLHSYRMAINHLSDMTTQEVNHMLKGYKMRSRQLSTSTFVPPSNVELPSEVDWRQKGLVTGVKDQKQCGGCWAFSATGSLEGQHKKATGNLVSLSEQNLIDCSKSQGNNGCNGGLMDYAFEYIKQNNGIDTEESYPYEAKDGKCRFNRRNVGASVTGYSDISSGDEDALLKAVATVGPVSVAIDASQFSFNQYREGVYDEPQCSSTQLDHGVLVVGYGTENGKDYWLVKNSWGTVWGTAGYIKMSRNRNNQCGIATQASYPLV